MEMDLRDENLYVTPTVHYLFARMRWGMLEISPHIPDLSLYDFPFVWFIEIMAKRAAIQYGSEIELVRELCREEQQEF